MIGEEEFPPGAKIGRRKFLKRTFLGAAALSVARLLPEASVFADIPENIRGQLSYFSEQEYLIVSATAARLTSHSACDTPSEKTIDVALRADKFLSNEQPEIQEQIHLLLTIFNSTIVAFLFHFKFSTFLKMDVEAQDSYLDGWMTSWFDFRRTGFQALKRLCMSMHYTDTRSWDEIRYHGMFMPEEQR
jgi:hypothetical protein